jgi:hypothetical protein
MTLARAQRRGKLAKNSAKLMSANADLKWRRIKSGYHASV